jgi:hypothetical protein
MTAGKLLKLLDFSFLLLNFPFFILFWILQSIKMNNRVSTERSDTEIEVNIKADSEIIELNLSNFKAIKGGMNTINFTF